MEVTYMSSKPWNEKYLGE